jgi:hypothetical protein
MAAQQVADEVRSQEVLYQLRIARSKNARASRQQRRAAGSQTIAWNA